MNWIFLLMVALAGFFGAGVVSMWRTQHRFAAGILGAIAVACAVIAVLSLLGPEES